MEGSNFKELFQTMMTKRIKAVIFLIILFAAQNAYTQNPTGVLTLKQCVDIALQNNLDVKQSDLQSQSDAIRLKQAKDNRLPDVFGNLNQGLNQGRSIDPSSNSYINEQIFYGNYSLSTSVTLFNGLQLKNIVKQNNLGYEASKMELQQTKDNLMLNVILAYVQVLSNEDLLTQSQNQVALSKKQVERMEILNKEGSVIPAQLYELRGTLASDQLAVVSNQSAVETSKLALAQLMNVPYTKDMQVERLTADQYASKYEGDPEKIYQQAMSQLAIIKGTEFRRQSAEKGVQVARGQYYPVISLTGALASNYSNAAQTDILLNTIQVPSGDYVTVNGNQVPVITTKSNFRSQKITYLDQIQNNYNTSINLGIRIPIVNSFQAKHNVALAKNDLKNFEYIEQTTKIQLKQSIEQAFVNMNAAFDRYTTLLQQVNDFAEAFRIAEVRFNAGATNQVEYLIARNNLDRARINLISAKYDYVFRTKILDYYQGKLVL